jgi:hypothetical protein
MLGAGMTAHSVYFLALGELGLPGLLLVLVFIIGSLVANGRLASLARSRLGRSSMEVQLLASMSASVIAFAVAGAFLSALYYPHIYVMAGIQVAARHLVRQRCEAGEGVEQVAQAERSITTHPALRPRQRDAAALLR